MTSFRRMLPLIFALIVFSPLAARATTAKFDVDLPSNGPFPSDVFSVADPGHKTGIRVNLPKLNCTARPSDCADIDVLNTLDGFNPQPRISIPFNGPIDPASVSSATVFLVSLGSTLGGGGGKRVEINQMVWEPAAKTLHVESDELLDQHTRYLLVATKGMRDLDGNPVNAGQFGAFLHRSNLSPAHAAYRQELVDALRDAGVSVDSVVAASVFTTQSATAILEKIRDQIKAATPARATFTLGPGGSRTVFPVSTITGMTFNQQRTTGSTMTSVNAPDVPGVLLGSPLALAFVLNLAPGSIGTIAFGQYQSPDYLAPDTRLLPPYGTATGVPQVFASNAIQFNLFLPSATKPAGGYPVAIFGHGFGDNKNNSPFFVAAVLANHGIATIAVNVVGHGRGAASTLTVNRPTLAGGPVTFNAGSRGYDQDGNGVIDTTEGVNALVPLVGSRDGLRQTVVDLMQWCA